MKKFIPALFIFFSCSSGHIPTNAVEQEKKYICDPTNTLSEKTETLTLEYIVWGCACANWITPAEYEKYQDNKLAEHCIFIEPATKSVNLPDNFEASTHIIKVKGQFYTKPDYPKGTVESEEVLSKAKVFRYTEIEVMEKNS